MIAGKTWREARKVVFLYLFLLEALLVLALVQWPEAAETLGRQARVYENLIPMKSWKEMFRSLGSTENELVFRTYLAVQQFFKAANILGIACAVLVGTGIIAREREEGTLELLLSRAVSRGRVLWSMTWVLSLCVLVPIFLSSLTIPLLSLFYDQEVPVGALLLASFHAGLIALLILAGTILLSVLLKTQVHVASVIGGIVILEVGLYFIPTVRSGSLFILTDYRVYGPILAGNLHFLEAFRRWDSWLLLAMFLLWGLTFLRFRRMDI